MSPEVPVVRVVSLRLPISDLILSLSSPPDLLFAPLLCVSAHLPLPSPALTALYFADPLPRSPSTFANPSLSPASSAQTKAAHSNRPPTATGYISSALSGCRRRGSYFFLLPFLPVFVLFSSCFHTVFVLFSSSLPPFFPRSFLPFLHGQCFFSFSRSFFFTSFFFGLSYFLLLRLSSFFFLPSFFLSFLSSLFLCDCLTLIPLSDRVSNDTFMEPVIGVERISKQRWKLVCPVSLLPPALSFSAPSLSFPVLPSIPIPSRAVLS